MTLREALAVPFLQPETNRYIVTLLAIKGRCINRLRSGNDYTQYVVTLYDEQLLSSFPVNRAQPTIYKLVMTNDIYPRGVDYFPDDVYPREETYNSNVISEIEAYLLNKYQVPIDTGWEHLPGPFLPRKK